MFRLISIVMLFSTSIAFAQQQILTSEGIAGDIDKHHRSPFLSVSHKLENSSVKILADGYLPNKEFEKYPIQFDFFVNRRLFSSQIRSPELPGPIGIDVGRDIAAPPFNYTVVAKVLHPNKTYTTVINGAVFNNSLDLRLDCILTLNSVTIDNGTFQADAVSTTQISDDQLALSFEAESLALGVTVAVDSNITVGESTASGSLSLVQDGTSTSHIVNGTVIRSDSGDYLGFNVVSADSQVALECQ